MTDCPDCTAAQTEPHHAGLRASCEGCKVRALANSLIFWHSRRARDVLPPYKKELLAVFGEEWDAGNKRVQAEYKRLRGMGKQA